MGGLKTLNLLLRYLADKGKDRESARGESTPLQWQLYPEVPETTKWDKNVAGVTLRKQRLGEMIP